MPSPFDLHNTSAYHAWREKKLAAYPYSLSQQIIEIDDPFQLDTSTLHALQQSAAHYNTVFYRLPAAFAAQKSAVHTLAKQLGLVRLDNNLCADADALTSLTVTKHQGQHDYIPYTSKKLSWHTDGYYNPPAQHIRGVLLHCVQPAAEGGESRLLDHEIAYILLRDENPDYIAALMQPTVMTIPANELNGKVIRPASTGAVFQISSDGHLQMRYSARLRHIVWKDDPTVKAACDCLQALWENEDSPYMMRYTLQAGEGVICNNTLHRRTAFKDADDPQTKRLLFRGRYYDRIQCSATQC
ncbi:MAG: TauD/TfdA family dioxygenase [bacterium]